MAYINWERTFPVDPATGEVLPIGTEDALELPTYGNYGGGGYSAGEFGGQLLTTSSGRPLSQTRLTKLGSESEDPLDRLDYLFYKHDVASNDVGEAYTRGQAKADASLVKSLIKLDASYDPEASLYAGGSTFAMIGRLAINDKLHFLPPKVLITAVEDAVGDIQYGLENLPQQELVAALGTLFEPTSETGVFAFDFEVETTSTGQEFIEYIALTVLNDAIDFDEIDDAPLDTGFPVSGVSEYRLTFEVATRDLDFLSV
ncbi:hypothetical protein BB934_34620 (plasmid) [Microvirga ossetica]|uniref:Uncharacterized protein n=1 Tax=Microvirga ossetica TaxID=1882682 RepID=A0A1B2ETY0_9HYPH|nr:hypothetical protein [Microvirga ossetica]ANY83421.1 hypothetical protein BB934_34620 [Microvirga ossetica]